MYDLVFCEKPSQGKDVARTIGATQAKAGYIEGRGYKVSWGFGHLMEMLEPEAYDVKWKMWSPELLPIIPDEIKYRVKKDCKKQFTVLKNLIAKARRVIIATDGDREGEAIAREVLEHCRYKGEIKRAWITSTDEESVKEAFANLKDGDETYGYYLAAKARAILDWLVGMNFSRALAARRKTKTGFKISYGRVQSPTLAILVEREKAIKNFKPEPHYGAEALFSARDGRFKATWEVVKEACDERGYLMDRSVAEYVVSHVLQSANVVSKAEYTRKKEAAPLPYKLSQLIKDASKFGMSPADTKKAMQTLYDSPLSLLSYPRTDSNYLPESMLGWVEPILQNATDIGYAECVAGLDPGKKSKCWNTKKITAHHAIIPTRKKPKQGELTGNLAIIYDLVMRRFLMQFAPERESDAAVIEVDASGLVFKATATVERFAGWKALRPNTAVSEGDSEAGAVLPRVVEGESVSPVEAFVVQKQTKKPSRFDEAGIVEEMGRAAKYCQSKELASVIKDGGGLGTEATRPDIVTEIGRKKQYQSDKKGVITVPAEVVDFFDREIPEYLKLVDSTATLELALDAVEKRELSLNEFLAAQKQYVRETVAELLATVS